jgi:DNA-binding MarR family transcriptional regulator
MRYNNINCKYDFEGDCLNAFEEYISILINQVNTTINTAVKNQLVPYNLAPEQSLILFVLRLEDGLTQKEIGEKLNKDKANIARMAYNLEQKGFIKRVPDPNDRRILKLYLTPEGKVVYNEALAVFNEFDKKISSKVTEVELRELKRILYKLTSEE